MPEHALMLPVLAGCSLLGLLGTLLLTLRLRTLHRRLKEDASPGVPSESPVLAEDLPGPPAPAGPQPSEEGRETAGRFTPTLVKAGLRDHLERGWQRRGTPEKYRVIPLLDENGVSGRDIARELNMPIDEVEQVLNLLRLARRRRKEPAKPSRRSDRGHDSLKNSRAATDMRSSSPSRSRKDSP